MPEVYKVGLTTGSVKQRIQELNTTGVPRPFKAEKLFEIPQSTLRDVEQLAHRKLKNKDLHHGKEFFEGSLQDCVNAVEDAIHEITKSDSIELIGQAKIRAANEQKKREEYLRLRELENQKKLEQEKKLIEINLEVDRQRNNYFSQIIIEENKNESFLDKYFWAPIGFLFLGGVGLAIMISVGPLGWIGIPILGWWFINKDKNDTKERRLKAAESKFPYVTKFELANRTNNIFVPSVEQKTLPATIKLIDPYKSVEKNINSKIATNPILENRKKEISNLDEVDPSDWVVDSFKSWLYNKKTKTLLSTKSGLGFSVTDEYFILNNLTKSRRLSVEKTLVDDDAFKNIYKH
jgi:hypothetical protein